MVLNEQYTSKYKESLLPQQHCQFQAPLRIFKIPCNYVFGKVIQVSAGKMYSRYVSVRQKLNKSYFASTRAE